MTADNQLKEIKDPQMETLRSLNNVEIERFLWYHAGCSVVEVDLPTTNSDLVDPTTGDLLPVFKKVHHCNDHNVNSLEVVRTGV